MESNKILIGVTFYDSPQNVTFELIVLRDSTLKQLLEGIKYGLEKVNKNADNSEEQHPFQVCQKIFNKCLKSDGTVDLKKITITSYNEAIKVKKNEKFRIIISEDDKNKKLDELGFFTSTRLVFDPLENYSSFEIETSNIIEAFNPDTNPKTEIVFPEYNISSRQLYQFNQTPVKIIAPSEPPKKPNQSLFRMILPTLLMVGVMVLVRVGISSSVSGGSSSLSMVFMTAAMGAVTLVTSMLNWQSQKKAFKKDLKDWREHYEEYIASLIQNIKDRQKQDVAKLNELYPDVNRLVENDPRGYGVYNVSGDIFSRVQNDDDFLTVRLGLSDDVPSKFKIEGDEKDVIFSVANFDFIKDSQGTESVILHVPEDSDYVQNTDHKTYLSNLPSAISGRYKNLKNAPLLYSIKNSGALGIVSKSKDLSDELIERIIFELSYYHSPDDLQFIIFFEKTDSNRWDIIDQMISNYKFTPHFRGLFSDKSQFVFDEKSASKVFGSLLSIMGERMSAKASLPHIVCIMFEEYGIKEHAFAEYLPKNPSNGKNYEDTLGLTFIFPKKYKEHLPKYCGEVINLDNMPVIIPHNDENLKKSFNYKPFQDERIIYQSYKVLSAILYAKISQNGKVPSNVNLFELFQITQENLSEKLTEFWGFDNQGKRIYDVTKSLAVPVGRTENGVAYLDLHEKFDGPHMLVAGTTGSGKSETIISYLLGLCLRFRPDEVNMMLVDMKGGGFIKRIGELPHVVGKVTDVDGDENGTGAAYMLNRFLNALAAEIKRRKILFNQMHVDSIDGYIKACRDVEGHIKKIESELTESNKNEIRRLAKEEKLAHLLLVVDEFTELKRFSTENDDMDFMGEITTIARVGRSLGFHIILISQNIEGAITEDIRINSKSRLCLKVATRQASKEMIGNDLAAAPSMPGNGRAYLLVGTGSKFEYFQSAYSGANATESGELPVEFVLAEKTGQYTMFYQSKDDNKANKEYEEKLRKEGKLKNQLAVIVNTIIKKYNNDNNQEYSKPHIVFQPPLPSKLILKDDVLVTLDSRES